MGKVPVSFDTTRCLMSSPVETPSAGVRQPMSLPDHLGEWQLPLGGIGALKGWSATTGTIRSSSMDWVGRWPWSLRQIRLTPSGCTRKRCISLITVIRQFRRRITIGSCTVRRVAALVT
jgi:hypothetical protein